MIRGLNHLWNVKQCKLEPEVRLDPLNLWSLVNFRIPGDTLAPICQLTNTMMRKRWIKITLDNFPFLAVPLIWGNPHSGSPTPDLIWWNHNRWTNFITPPTRLDIRVSLKSPKFEFCFLVLTTPVSRSLICLHQWLVGSGSDSITSSSQGQR